MKLIPLIDMSAVMLSQLRITASANGTGVDVKNFDGPAIAVVNAHNVSGTTPTLALAITESDTQGGAYTAHSPAVTLGGITTTDVCQTLSLGDIAEWKRWIRLEATAGGTSPVYDLAVILVAAAKYN